ncbi:Chitinase [Shewanella baltica OS183]|uniref:chitinase C-terminal domain-containing protein n=1 Tax=Shewanella baltica TaxID=62322 RepID=UPI0001E10D27|nr:glycosyl hydrolase family 18 protein [Shewanella baltica]AEG11157.1 Chitinase [Shewanella baltica BA175]EHQ15313.1 Chitinase [Shewanella baltica OS183]
MICNIPWVMKQQRFAWLMATAMAGFSYSQTAAAVSCQDIAPWNSSQIYATVTPVTYDNYLYQNKWWTQNENPSQTGQWGVWENKGVCDGAQNQAPTLVILQPQNNVSVNLGDVVVLQADASDVDGTVASVNWFANGQAVTSPWATNAIGSVQLKAVATDDKGATTEKSVVLTVINATSENLPPAIEILSPLNDSVVTIGDSVTISANASDPDSGDSITKVEFYLDSQLIATDDSAPYSATWQAVGVGVHQLQTRAYDIHNASGLSAIIKLNVVAANQAPSVTLTAPQSNFQTDLGTVLSLAATATDSDGDVASVRFYANGLLVAEDATAPYSAQWTAIENGDIRFTAEAIDNLGLTTLSTAVIGRVGQAPTDNEACRPEGLVGDSVYCDVYDEQGREKMGSDHARRVIGYFTSWRTGKNGQPSYLASDIPWDKITHINYAFAHIDSNNKVSIGDPNSATNAATGLEWPGVTGAEMDPEFDYKGHFNLLNKYKKRHPNVKTLISIGGWAETGGYFDDNGNRVASGGFYEMTQTTQGIETFADSVVTFLRTYSFDGADIDYEYATSMAKSGNPDDFSMSEPKRAILFKQYELLMKTLREKLDTASKQDGKHYMLTVAAPASGYLLRGMEAYQMTRYLDYVNIMSYDLHGAWNDFVGHNAALFDTGTDAELAHWDVYSTAQYGGIGYLNTDWAYHYFRGSMPAGRINIGIPYYTRGWQNVSGGTNGLWGLAAYPDQTACPVGTGDGASNCGYGAQGIDNLWHDSDVRGDEMFAGSNPMWHAKNLELGISGSYLSLYGLDPQTNVADRLTGTYERHYDAVAESSWLWNPTKKVYLSTEDEQAMARKVQYVVDNGIGGVMFWELAGDFGWHPERNNGQGEFFVGDTMTSIAYNGFAQATPYGNRTSNQLMPSQTLALTASLSGYKVGDSNYPITPTLTITNNSQVTIPGGAEFEFDISTSTSAEIADQSGMGLTVVTDGSNVAGNNVGGLENDFHHVRFILPTWKSLAPGATFDGTIKYYLPVSMPSNFTVSFNGTRYGFGAASSVVPPVDCAVNPSLPECQVPEVDSCEAASVDTAGIPAYPNFPQKDYQGNPSHAATGDRMKNSSAVYQAKWWTNAAPGSSADWAFVCNL